MKKIEFGKILQVETNEDNTLNIQAAETWIIDYAGKREAETEIVLSIFDVNTGDEIFTSLTTSQVDMLVKRLQNLNSRIKEYNQFL